MIFGLKMNKLEQEIVDALLKAKEINLKMNIDGMSTDEAANYIINTLQDHGCLRETRNEKI
jgi:hypothetical protein